VFVSAAYLVVFAPVVVRVLLEHGAFDATDTAATAAIMRVYALGLLGHAMVGVLSRPFFTGERPNWFPAAAMAVGVAVNAVLAALAVPHFGATGLAAANGIGITVAAVLLLIGLRNRIVAVSLGAVGFSVLRLGAAAVAAGFAGWLAGRAMAGLPSVVVGAAGGLVVLGVFVLLTHRLLRSVRDGH
jgi:putative peptidoglycan lipid II flippase